MSTERHAQDLRTRRGSRQQREAPSGGWWVTAGYSSGGAGSSALAQSRLLTQRVLARITPPAFPVRSGWASVPSRPHRWNTSSASSADGLAARSASLSLGASHLAAGADGAVQHRLRRCGVDKRHCVSNTYPIAIIAHGRCSFDCPRTDASGAWGVAVGTCPSSSSLAARRDY